MKSQTARATLAKLAKLNSMTKYPSISTYHELDKSNGRLLPQLAVQFGADDEVHVTEKIDGTNARIIVVPEALFELVDRRYFIGSREELLTAEGDLVVNPQFGIVEAARAAAEALTKIDDQRLYVVYGEVYGGKIQNAKAYTATGTYGFRIFDAWTMPADLVAPVLTNLAIDKIAAWRDAGGQPFAEFCWTRSFASIYGIAPVPALARVKGSDLPVGNEEALGFLRQHAGRTVAQLDDAQSAPAEGIVIRNEDRSRIAKLRFEDYERTLRRRSNR